MQIHQLSVSYQAEQDRLLLRVSSTGGEEMRLWLTRRLMLGFWPLISQDELRRISDEYKRVAGFALEPQARG